MVRRFSVAMTAVVALVAGCTVGNIDYTGKGCSLEAPCPGGFACVSGACQKAAPAQTCTPAFTVSGFKRVWETPHTVRWSWTPNGSSSDFVQYKLVLGTSADELESARQLALSGGNDGLGHDVWTQKDNPELGQYELRLSRGTDPVAATTTDGLSPGTEYQARLLVYDSAGCVYTTTVVHAVTSALSSFSYVLFDDQAHPSGQVRPPDATLRTDAANAYDGTRYIYWPGWPTDGSVATGTYQNVGLFEIDSDPAADYPRLDFTAAYLEVAIAIDGPPLAAWGEARLIFGPSPGICSSITTSSIHPYVFRPGAGYQVLELPLNEFELESGGNKLDASMLTTRSICEVSLGRSWAIGESVRVDGIRLRW